MEMIYANTGRVLKLQVPEIPSKCASFQCLTWPGKRTELSQQLKPVRSNTPNRQCNQFIDLNAMGNTIILFMYALPVMSKLWRNIIVHLAILFLAWALIDLFSHVTTHDSQPHPFCVMYLMPCIIMEKCFVANYRLYFLLPCLFILHWLYSSFCSRKMFDRQSSLGIPCMSTVCKSY